jgi:multiple sugar transport system permease protein
MGTSQKEMGMDSATKAGGAVKTAVPPTAAAIHKVLDFFLRDQVVGYVLILPALILIASLIVYPFFYALWLSVSNAWVGSPGRFVGLANYLKLVNNNIFRQTLQNSLVFTGASVALKTVFGIGLALLLNKAVFLKRFIRGSILLPFVAPTALTTLGWWWMYEPMYSVFNWTLVHLGLIDKGLPWLSNPTLAMLAVISVNFWRGLPFFAITILAGLMAIPKELYEAAEVDGANALGRFYHITLPLLKPVLAVVILFSTIFTLADFNIVYILTRGGPMNMTHLFATLSFEIGLQGGIISEGAAVSLFLFPILVAVVYFQLRLVRRQTHY